MKNPATAFVLFVVATAGLTMVMRSPRFEAFRTVDVLQLLGSGMCFGVGLTMLLARLRSGRGDKIP